MNKNVIIAGVIAIGLYLFSQGKSIFSVAAPQTTGQRTAQKADISRLPVKQIRDMIAHAAAQKKTGKEAIVLKAELARREAAYTAALRKAAVRKAAVRKAEALMIGKKIGKTVAQKAKALRAVMVWYAKRQKPQIQRPRPNKKQIASRLFSGAEKSRIIPYYESRKHSYYGPKSHKVLNPGYMEKRYKADQKQALEFRLNELRTMFPRSNL